MIIVICGPTASGKSEWALRLAQEMKGELINGDAFQIYQGMDIGTAKSDLVTRQIVPHHLFDILHPNEEYSIKHYQSDARRIIDEVQKRGHLPIIVGGSGLYLKAALYDYHFADEQATLRDEFAHLSNEELYQQLLKVDFETAQKLHANNRRRVIRALQIKQTQGKSKSELEAMQKHEPIYPNVIFIGIVVDRLALNERIEQRVELMWKQGLKEEALSLYDRYGPSAFALRAIGYREWQDYRLGLASEEEVKASVTKHTRQYAKRQMTFFRHQLPVQWFTTYSEAVQWLQRRLNDEGM